MKLTGLNFCKNGSTYLSQWWPSEKTLLVDELYLLYDPDKHLIHYGEIVTRNHTLTTIKDIEQQIMENDPSIRKVTEAEREQIRKRYRQREKSAVSAGGRRRFEKAVIPSASKMPDSLTVIRFLEGATSGGSSLKIEGDHLVYYSEHLMTRIGESEFLLGRSMTMLALNPPACTARVWNVLNLQKHLTLWPSIPTRSMYGKEEDASGAILKYLTNAALFIQLKMPTARDKSPYRFMFQDTKRTYELAKGRWGISSAALEEMFDKFDDLEEMKAYNSALRMQFELTGKVEI